MLERTAGDPETALRDFSAARGIAAGVCSDSEIRAMEDEVANLQKEIGAKTNRATELFKQAKEREKNCEYERAVELYSKAIAEDEGRIAAYLQRGKCLQMLNEHARAIPDFDRCCDLIRKAPDLDRKLMYQALYYLGRSRLDEGNYGLAVDVFSQAAECAVRSVYTEDRKVIDQDLALARSRLEAFFRRSHAMI